MCTTTNHNTRTVLTTDALTLTVPTDWRGCSEEQLYYLFYLLSNPAYGAAGAWALALIRFNGLSIEGSAADGALCVSRKVRGRHWFFAPVEKVRIEPAALYEALALMEWIDHVPETFVVRLPRIGKAKALSEQLTEVSFETYLIIENLYQGHLQSGKEQPLNTLLRVLYPDLKPEQKFSRVHRYNALFWMTSLHNVLYRHFDALFKPLPEGTEPPVMADRMNAQIRALTGGDVTKEKAVMQTPMWRALTELDAKAREADEMKSKYNL